MIQHTDYGIFIILEHEQNAYDIIGEYVIRHWQHSYYDDAVVCMDISYDNKEYYNANDYVTPVREFKDYGVIFENDWWEGEKYIKLYGIKNISEIELTGGLYDKV